MELKIQKLLIPVIQKSKSNVTCIGVWVWEFSEKTPPLHQSYKIQWCHLVISGRLLYAYKDNTNCECISKRLIEITPSWILVKWKCVLSRNFGEFNNNYRFVKNYLLHVGVRMWAEINTCICTSSIILIQNLSLLLQINRNNVYQLLCSLMWPHWTI